MIQGDGGSIIITSSITAFAGGLSSSCAYPATKAAVIGFCKDTAVKYARYHIRVNCVCPGQIETPLVRERLQADRDTLVKKYPLGRFGQPIDIAYAVLFLASDEASFVTGTELIVDGGYTAQ
jgi:NAD(P)-dependent dehydrogenase (short-subunit alcohol dehydrogenase family)